MAGAAMTKKRIRPACWLALSLALVAGCARRPAAPAGTGGEVVVGILADISTFNEYQSLGDAYEMEVMDLLFPSLMAEQADWEEHPPTFLPSLASRWETSADGRVITFHLRPDARWSDGAPITADDVRFTFDVQRDERISAPGLEIKRFIEAVEVVDPHTVRFRFSRVYPYQLMDANDGHIIPRHAWGAVPLERWESTDFGTMLVTGGPFRVASHARAQTLTLERDPLWWGAPRPYLDRLVFRVVPDSGGQLAQLLAGHLDLVEVVPPREAGRIAARPELELLRLPGRTWGFVAWNNRRPAFADRDTRRALSFAINRAALVESVYHGYARVGRGPVLASMWAFNNRLEELPFDPARARELLARAGWRADDGDGTLERGGRRFEFDLLLPAGNNLRRDMALLIQADLARLGIRCRPREVESAAMLALLDTGDFDASLTAYTEGTKVDLAGVWATPSAEGGSYNVAGYSNPEVDRLIAEADAVADFRAAKPILDRVQELIVADQPVTFLYESDKLVAISRRIRGARINSSSVFFNADEWTVGP
jgi:peptide/nickel transport system substrate-binding protein